MILEYVLLNIVVITIYLAYLNKKVKYKVAIISALLWTVVVGFINVYNHHRIEKILNKDIFGPYTLTLLVHFIFGIVAGLFLETLSYYFKRSSNNKNGILLLANIALILIYILLCFEIDFFTNNF